MEKAIEIKRRAQRCILNGDLDGALSEYERLVASGDSDPYHSVLLADLLYKKGDAENAARRYFEAVDGYEKSSLLKNAIAVCKKMSRLAFAPAAVLERLAQLHALDGFATEASLYYLQHGDIMQNQNALERAAGSFEKAFQVHPENVKALERLAEVLNLQGEAGKAAIVLLDAAAHYDRQGQLAEAKRCQARAEFFDPASVHGAAGSESAAEARVGEAAAEDTSASSLGTLPPPILRPHEDPGADLEGEPTRDLVFPRFQAPDAPPAEFDSDREPLRIESSSLAAEQAAQAEVELEEGAEQVFDLDAELEGVRPATDAPESIAATASEEEPEVAAYSAASFGAIDLDSGEAILAPPVPAPVPVAEAMPVSEAYSIAEAAGVAGAFFGSRAGGPVEDIEDSTAGTDESTQEVADPTAERSGSITDLPVPIVAGADVVAGADGAASAEASIEAPAAAGEFAFEGVSSNTSPAAPGLAFDAPAAGPRSDAEAVPADEEAGLAEVSALLATAQEEFKTGEREAASSALQAAAQSYDRIGRFDSAASIYRSLSQTSTGSPELMMQWLRNCECRADVREAAHVACELGERAMNDGDLRSARAWFERAHEFDAGNEIALRRLQRLTQPEPSGGGIAVAAPAATPPAARPAAPPAVPSPLGVQMDQSIPENVDLGVLIAEFQRSVSVELAGDAQSHYDLAMSYREMGLINESLESFAIAARDPAFRVRASEMTGRCMLDLGRFDEAAHAIRVALAEPGLAVDSQLNLRYHLALALEAAGDMPGALGEFEAVYAAASSYADVAVRIRALRKSMGMA